MNQEPIFILGAHKSGTSLLRSLLDGHPDLYCIPIESHPFEHLGYWVLNDYRGQLPVRRNRDEILSAMRNWIATSNRTEAGMGDSFAKNRFDLNRFETLVTQMPTNPDPKTALATYFEAIYGSTTGNDPTDSVRFVEKSVEHSEFAPLLHKLFPAATFLHIIRNPYANMVSLRRYKSLTFGYPVLKRMLKTFETSYYSLLSNRRLIPNEQYHVLRYEDLLQETEPTMRRVSEALGISFQPSLTTPTLQGEHWQGNSSRNRSFTEVSTSPLTSWQGEIEPVEIYYVNRLFGYLLEEFGYDHLAMNGSFWKRASGEPLFRYLANRTYRKFLFQ